MIQVLFIHGGESYPSDEEYIADLVTQPLQYERLKYHKRWREWIAEQVTAEFDILTPTFPNGFNAQYDEWIIYFEKIVPFLNDGAMVVGHSLGAMFLAKYLHDHVLPVRLRRIILIAGRYGTDEYDHGGSFVVNNATGVGRSCDEVHLFHSKDDPVVKYENLTKFEHDIPGAVVHSYEDRGHFNTSTFPELLLLLQQK